MRRNKSRIGRKEFEALHAPSDQDPSAISRSLCVALKSGEVTRRQVDPQRRRILRHHVLGRRLLDDIGGLGVLAWLAAK